MARRIIDQVDLITSQAPFFPGKKVFLDPVNGSDGNTGYAPGQARKTWAQVYKLLTTNKNDMLFIIGGASAITVTAEIDWTLAYTHIIGLAAPVGYGIRNRISTSTADVVNTFHMSSAANGCIIKNIMFGNEGDDVHNITAVKVDGARNYFENCTFRVIGATAVAGTGKIDFVLASANGENRFKRCTFGTDTYDGSADAANYNFEFSGANQTARNIFDECIFLGSGSAGAAWIKATTVSSLSSFQLFNKCLFYNNANGTMNAMTQGFNINAGAGGQLILREPEIYGCTNLETSDSGLLIGSNVNAAATTGKMLALTW